MIVGTVVGICPGVAVVGRAVIHRPLPRPKYWTSSVPLAAVPASVAELPVPGVPLHRQVLRLFAALAAVVVAGSLTEVLPREQIIWVPKPV